MCRQSFSTTWIENVEDKAVLFDCKTKDFNFVCHPEMLDNAWISMNAINYIRHYYGYFG